MLCLSYRQAKVQTAGTALDGPRSVLGLQDNGAGGAGSRCGCASTDVCLPGRGRHLCVARYEMRRAELSLVSVLLPGLPSRFRRRVGSPFAIALSGAWPCQQEEDQQQQQQQQRQAHPRRRRISSTATMTMLASTRVSRSESERERESRRSCV